MQPNKSNTYCHYPFHEVTLKNWRDGKLEYSWPCCHMGDTEDHKEHWILDDIENLTPEEIHNHPRMELLRQRALNGERDPACAICWKNEDKGLMSNRFFSDDPSFIYEPEGTLSIDIIASNICNLRCRMCSPTASHQLMKDYKFFENNNMLDEVWESVDKRFAHSWSLQATDSVQWKWLLDNTDRVSNIKGSGGEPFYDPKTIDFLRKFVETGNAKNTNLTFITNGTQFTDEVCELLSKFKNNFHNFSIDAAGKTYEYIRYPQSFENLNKSLVNYFQNVPNRHASKFTLILSAHNILNLSTYFDWVYSLDDFATIIISEVYPEDRGIHIKHLPVEVLQEAKQRITGYEHKFKSNSAQYFNLLDIIDYYINNNEENTIKLYRETRVFDTSRSQSYKDYLDPVIVSAINSGKNLYESNNKKIQWQAAKNELDKLL